MVDLLINGNENTFRDYGVRLGEGFIDALLAPESLKEFIENSSRLEHGRRVTVANPRMDARDLTLVFTLEGDSPEDYQTKYKAFKRELMKGEITLKVPGLGEETYYLVYQKATSFAMNTARTVSKISVKFLEPDPSRRA